MRPEDAAGMEHLRASIDGALGTLSSREQEVLRMRFGLEDGKPRTLEEIGDMFAVTRERVRQIEARALHKLRQPYRHQSLRELAETSERLLSTAAR